MDLVERLECGCNPGKVYGSRGTFKKHLESNRHKAWVSDKNTKDKATEKTETSIDILKRRLEKSELERKDLLKRVDVLEIALASMSLKRAVTESKKKKVAADQTWRCAACRHTLSHVFEVDHVKPLFMGGNNDVSNLQALCRECHGKKTAADKERFWSRRREPRRSPYLS